MVVLALCFRYFVILSRCSDGSVLLQFQFESTRLRDVNSHSHGTHDIRNSDYGVFPKVIGRILDDLGVQVSRQLYVQDMSACKLSVVA